MSNTTISAADEAALDSLFDEAIDVQVNEIRRYVDSMRRYVDSARRYVAS